MSISDLHSEESDCFENFKTFKNASKLAVTAIKQGLQERIEMLNNRERLSQNFN
jgi:hypothetical protein